MAYLTALANLFISPAYAADAGAPQAAGGNFSMLFVMIMLVVFMYLMVWRPQSKRAKEQKELLSSISLGDEVVTIGGLVGKITKLSETYVTISPSEGIQIPFQKSAVANVLPKGTLKTL